MTVRVAGVKRKGLYIETTYYKNGDYGVWVTQDIKDDASGWSVRGSKGGVELELRKLELLSEAEIKKLL